MTAAVLCPSALHKPGRLRLVPRLALLKQRLAQAHVCGAEQRRAVWMRGDLLGEYWVCKRHVQRERAQSLQGKPMGSQAGSPLRGHEEAWKKSRDAAWHAHSSTYAHSVKSSLFGNSACAIARSNHVLSCLQTAGSERLL